MFDTQRDFDLMRIKNAEFERDNALRKCDQLKAELHEARCKCIQLHDENGELRNSLSTIGNERDQLKTQSTELSAHLDKIIRLFESCIEGGNGELEGDRPAIEQAREAIRKAGGSHE